MSALLSDLLEGLQAALMHRADNHRNGSSNTPGRLPPGRGLRPCFTFTAIRFTAPTGGPRRGGGCMPAPMMAAQRLVGCGKTRFPGEDVLAHRGRRRRASCGISVKNQSNIRTVCSELMRPAAKVRLPVAGISVVKGRGRRRGRGGKVWC